jgi:uncharacterized protein
VNVGDLETFERFVKLCAGRIGQLLNASSLASDCGVAVDTGLSCHLLGVRDAAQLVSHPLRGALFENYVVAEVAKAYWHHRRTPPIHFWRDQTGHEVDLLVEEGGVAVRPWFAV